jgi:hypothetical protein
MEFNGEADHVHALASLPPNLDLSRFVNNLTPPAPAYCGETSPISFGAFIESRCSGRARIALSPAAARRCPVIKRYIKRGGATRALRRAAFTPSLAQYAQAGVLAASWKDPGPCPVPETTRIHGGTEPALVPIARLAQAGRQAGPLSGRSDRGGQDTRRGKAELAQAPAWCLFPGPHAWVANRRVPQAGRSPMAQRRPSR